LKARAAGAALLLGASLLAAAALADTLRRGERIAATTAPITTTASSAFTSTLPGVVGALAVHPDGRVAASARQELVLFAPSGATIVRRSLSGPASALAFGTGESVIAELATGSAVLRYRDLSPRAWSPAEATRAPVEPAALPFGGFVLARGSELVLTDGEAHETRRLQLGPDYPIARIHVLANRGIFVLASHGEAATALLHAAWGERVTLRAVVRGKLADSHLDARGLELSLEDGSLAHVDLGTGAIARLSMPDDAYAVTALRHDRSVGIVRGQLAVFRHEGGGLRAGAPFGPAVSRTDAGLVVPRVLVASAGADEPFWVLTSEGSVWRVDAAGTARFEHASGCDSARPAFLAATPGRVVVACQNRVTAIVTAPSPASPPSKGPPSTSSSDAGFRW